MFPSVADSTYEVQTENLGTEADTYLELMNSALDIVAWNNDCDEQTAPSCLEYVAPSNGNLYVRVTSMNGLWGPDATYDLWVKESSPTQTPTQTPTPSLTPTLTPTFTPTDTFTTTPTETPTPTNTPSPTQTPTPTDTPTNTPSPTNTPTPCSDVDLFEPDDLKTEANAIALDGTPQLHYLCSSMDGDWVSFTAQTDFTYEIEIGRAHV